MQLMDVLACNSANKQSFQNLTKSHFAQFLDFERWAISQITGQNVQKLPIFVIFAS